MIRHRIQHQLHPARMQRRRQRLQILQRPIVLIHAIQVRSPIPVITATLVILIHRSSPHRRHAQLLQIIQMLLNPLQIPAMPAPRLRPLRQQPPHCSLHSSRIRPIILQIPIRKTIRHDQVHHIARREPRKPIASRPRVANA